MINVYICKCGCVIGISIINNRTKKSRQEFNIDAYLQDNNPILIEGTKDKYYCKRCYNNGKTANNNNNSSNKTKQKK